MTYEAKKKKVLEATKKIHLHRFKARKYNTKLKDVLSKLSKLKPIQTVK